ncbi:Integrase catalytic region, partial [mine drainage metagenome]
VTSIFVSDRQRAIELIEEAHASSARYAKACEILEISVRTYQRWKRQEDALRDKRKGSHQNKPSHALTEEEEQLIINTCTKAEYSSLSPAQIVPKLADDGVYLESESTFWRVLRKIKC